MRWCAGLILLWPLMAGADVWDHGFKALLDAANAPPIGVEAGAARLEALEARMAEADPRVRLSLEALIDAQRRLKARAARAEEAAPAAVLIGAAHYSGAATPEALEMELELRVTLRREGAWKAAPLIGDDVALRAAQVDGQDLPLYVERGYYIWPTQRVGEVTVRLRFLVPALVEGGARVYRFHGPHSPMSTLSCRFPEGVEPQVEGARRATLRRDPQGATLEATLGAGAMITLKGARDLGEVEAREAKLYVEDLALLSVMESHLELFVVLRYTVLYAKRQRFEIDLPEGWSLTTAEGQEALRYQTTPRGEGQRLIGESAYPVQGDYEISLRLRRELPIQATDVGFALRLPRALGVERQSGWLAVEVQGGLRLEERARQRLLALDLRQLPLEMLESAAHPISRAYHHDHPDFDLTLSRIQLPEHPQAAGLIDEATAYTVITPNGQSLTELRLMMRPQQRDQLRLRLRPGVRLRSALLNGAPVKVSAGVVESGEGSTLLLPLSAEVSAAKAEETPTHEISVILEEQLPPAWNAGAKPPAWIGRTTFALPAVDLPIRALRLSLFMPPRDIYAGVDMGVAEQTISGYARWTSPLLDAALADEEAEAAPPSTAPLMVLSAETGAMPVRINVPRVGHRVDLRRYWLNADQPTEIRFWHARGWLIYPAQLLAVALLLLGLLGLRRGGRGLKALALLIGLSGGAALYALSDLQRLIWVTLTLSGLLALSPGGRAALQTQGARLSAELRAALSSRAVTPWTTRRALLLLWRVSLTLLALTLTFKALGLALDLLRHALA